MRQLLAYLNQPCHFAELTTQGDVHCTRLQYIGINAAVLLAVVALFAFSTLIESL